MGRIRTVKPDFWKHEALSNLPEATHMLAAALLNYADDEGYFNANPKLIKAELFPLREPSVSVHDSLTHLSNAGYIKLGVAPDGRQYGHIINFLQHQRVNRPIPSKIKGLDIDWDASLKTHTQLSESSLLEGNGREEEGKRNDIRAVATATRPSDDSFETFWKAYPKRDGANPKAPALKKYLAALKSGVPPGEIIAAAKRFAQECRSRGQIGTPYVAQAITWLNQQRWGDYAQPPPEEPTNTSGFYAGAATAELEAWDNYRRETEGKSWPRDARGGWRFPSQWPPETKAAAAA